MEALERLQGLVELKGKVVWVWCAGTGELHSARISSFLGRQSSWEGRLSVFLESASDSLWYVSSSEVSLQAHLEH